MNTKNKEIVVRALHTTQGSGVDVYAFFIGGGDVTKLADISRIERDPKDALKGFQRPEIRSHVKGIVDYLNQGNVLFPNAIILAMSPDVRFVAARGSKPTGDLGISQAGTLTIPIFEEGARVAWVVDGQQRSLALAQAKNSAIPVPVIGFVSDSIETQREQFILVNKAKPLLTIDHETRFALLGIDLNTYDATAQILDAYTVDEGDNDSIGQQSIIPVKVIANFPNVRGDLMSLESL